MALTRGVKLTDFYRLLNVSEHDLMFNLFLKILDGHKIILLAFSGYFPPSSCIPVVPVCIFPYV